MKKTKKKPAPEIPAAPVTVGTLQPVSIEKMEAVRDRFRNIKGALAKRASERLTAKLEARRAEAAKG